MVSLVMVLIAMTTSAGAYALATRRLRLRPADLPRALGAALDCIGLAVVFLVLNAVIGAGAIIGARALTGYFVSVYLMSDATLVLVSGLQGLIFWCWWQRDRSEAAPPRGLSGADGPAPPAAAVNSRGVGPRRGGVAAPPPSA